MTSELSRLEHLQYWLLTLIPISVAFYGVPLPNLFGARLRSYTLVMAAFFMISVLATLRDKQHLQLFSPATAAVLFLVIALTSIVYNGAVSGSFIRIKDMFTGLVQLLFNVSLLAFVGNLLITLQRLLLILRVWIGFTLIMTIYGIYQAFARTFDLPLAYLDFLIRNAGGTYAFIEPFRRPSALFGEPSFFGVYLAPPFIITTAYVLLSDCSIFSQRADEVSMYMLGIGIVLSFSLGTHVSLLAAFAVGTPLVLLVRQHDAQWSPVLRLLGAVAAVGGTLHLAGIPLVSGIVLRILSLFEFVNLTNVAQIGSSFAIRFAAIATGVTVWLHYPLLGVGLNNVRYFVDDYATIPFEIGPPIFDRVQSTGSAWIEALVGTGIFGFIAFLFIYILTLRNLLRHRSQSTHLCVLSIGLTLVLLFNMVNMFVTYTLYHPQRWFILGLCLVVFRLSLDDRHLSEGMITR